MNSRKKNQAEVSSTSAENSVEWLTTRMAIVEVLTGRLQQLLAGLLSDLSPTIRLFLDGALLVTADVASGRSEDQLRTLVGRLFGGSGSRIVLPSPARAQTLRPLPLRRLLPPPPPPPTLQPLAQRLETLIEEWSSRKRSVEEQQAKSLEEARKKKEEERKKKEEERKKKEEQDFLDLWKGPGVHILRVEANGLFICELQVQLMPRLTVSEMTRFSPL